MPGDQALRERQVPAHARADRRASGQSSMVRNLSRGRPTEACTTSSAQHFRW